MDYQTDALTEGLMLNARNVSPRSTSRARDTFLSNQKCPSLPVTGVRPIIYQSWLRSNSEGISSEQFSAPIVKSKEQAVRFRHKNKELHSAARGSFAQIGKMLNDAEAMLILTDSSGIVLEAIGDESTLEQGRKINLEVGGKWSEDASGTNGIGTALWAGHPVFVHGTEHFCDGMSSWSCAAAPIRDPLDQSIIGVVDLSGLTQIFRKHNAAFAAAAAGEIQTALAYAQNTLRARLLEAAIGNVPIEGQETEKIAIIDRFGRLIFSRNFEKTFLANGMELDIQLGRKLLDMTTGMSEEELLSSLPEELGCKEIFHLEVDGEFEGTALVFPSQKIHHTKNIRDHKPPDPGVSIMGTDLKIIGKSEAILEALDFANRIAHVNTPILIEGETGVGKELFARFIHSLADPAEHNPFFAINCSAVSQKMFVNELSAHGYNTGIPGKIVAAEKQDSPQHAKQGILCLDEIGELPLDIQPYLLRILEDWQAENHEYKQSLPKDSRLISLTNRVLLDEVEEGRFRRDLYYRIGTVALKIPPLRVRGEDILLITHYFNNVISEEMGEGPLVIKSEAQDALMAYSWPGNVRELRNLVAQLHYLTKSRYVGLDNLPQQIVESANQISTGNDTEENKPSHEPKAESLKQAEKELILQAISKHEGNLSRAAATLGVSRPTLYRKMSIYAIERS